MKRMKNSLAIIVFLPLLGCSAAEQCRLDAGTQLRVLDRMIADSETSIRQGYREVELDSPFHVGMSLCVGPPNSRLCDDDDDPVIRREWINVPAEKARLASLKAQRSVVAPRTAAAIAACPQP